MKYYLLFIILLYSTGSLFGQTTAISKAPARLKKEDFNTPSVLCRYLIADCTTDRGKVDHIFNWITDNISYQVRTYSRYKPSVFDDSDTGVLQPLDEIVARNVLQRRSGVCDGYARLFKRLCDYAGIRCEVITGYGRTGSARYFRSNHKWNAVYFDSAWHLLDATWASGYLNSTGSEFIKDYNGSYFLTSPKDFIRDHYPDDLRWTLLSEAPQLSEFNHSPYTSSAFNKYFITSYLPAKGIIDASVGDSISILLDMKTAKPQLFIADNPFIDSTTLFIQSSFGGLQSPAEVTGNTVRCVYKVASPSTEWLQVIYNGEVIMRYRLNIRKEVAVK